MSQEPVKALFLDRDGVINVDSGYIWRIEDFIFCDGVFDACIVARDMGYLLVVVTNQAGIGRGLYTEQQFRALTQWKEAQFRERGIEIARTYFSPTHPDEGIGVYKRESPDRKPGPGMLFKARDAFGIDMAASAIVGDRETDIEAGINGGVGTRILIEGVEDTETTRADVVVGSLAEAVAWLGARDGNR
ncbi:MAG: D-glycero-alpha-D-manno-heptose-1,7-bisphosphate 7-phosphatase [Alphaproteobacteria bacterium]